MDYWFVFAALYGQFATFFRFFLVFSGSGFGVWGIVGVCVVVIVVGSVCVGQRVQIVVLY